MTFAAAAMATYQADSGNFTDASSNNIGEGGDMDIEFASDNEQQQQY